MNNNNNRGSNNNNNNNRRRGRNNNNRQQGGGGQQLNRIDSRARGNAPQMLEKYRKLAHDAHLNGDRVQEEYFLQFADHYFRVIADQRVRQEEQRAPRQPGERWQEGEGSEREGGEREESNDSSSGEYGEESEYASSYDRPQYNTRNDRPERAERPERQERPERAERPERQERPERNERHQQFDRNERPARQRDDAPEVEARSDEPSEEADGNRSAYEPPVNPFVRDNSEVRGTRGLRPRREARPPRDNREPEAQLSLDPSLLPPAIAITPLREDDASEEAVEKPARRPRTPRAKKPASDTGETLEVVG